ncbi:MAG: bifunctional pyr operon transcriptional regulator/uracil phosphoribosyltransferase PyrR [bacterium]
MIEQEHMDNAAIMEMLKRMAGELSAHLQKNNISDPAMIGIHTGGVWIAEKLHELLELQGPLGVLDISFYRDDFTRIGLNPRVKPSNVPFDVDDRAIIVVDDVIQSGRTIRAAMNEIFDFGRPASITLVSLMDRCERELPIQPDVVGAHPKLGADQHIRLTGPDPLTLTISTTGEGS